MKRAVSLCVALLLFAFAAPAFAQVTPVPPLLNFEGRLARPDGTPVADGTHSVQFSLYSAKTGGTLKWTETDRVTVRNGVFAVLLGNGTALTDAVFASNSWLQLSVDGAMPLSPRQPLVSVAHAFKADTVPDASITDTQIAAGTITASKLAAGVAFTLPYAAALNSASTLLSITNSGSGGGGFFAGATYGVYGNSDAALDPSDTSKAIGVSGHSKNNVGVFGGGGITGVAGEGAQNGVSGISSAGSGVFGGSDSGVGVSGASKSGYAGYFTGNLAYTGTLTHASDARYKTHIVPLAHALDSVLALRGVTYDYNRAAFPALNLARGKQYGLVAQEVEAVLPSLVSKDRDGYRSLDYAQLVPVLIEAVKTQQQHMTSQQRRMGQLERQNARLEQQNVRIRALEARLNALLAARK